MIEAHVRKRPIRHTRNRVHDAVRDAVECDEPAQCDHPDSEETEGQAALTFSSAGSGCLSTSPLDGPSHDDPVLTLDPLDALGE